MLRKTACKRNQKDGQECPSYMKIDRLETLEACPTVNYFGIASTASRRPFMMIGAVSGPQLLISPYWDFRR